jgi:hypothetical protein
VDRVRESLEEGTPVDLQFAHGRTALMAAAEAGDLPMVRVLAEHGANLYVRDDQGRKALDLAKRAANPAVSTYLQARMDSSETIRKRAMSAKTLEEFIPQAPSVPELLNGIRDVLAGLPAGNRESARRAQAAVDELRQRVAEQWNPLEPVPPEYRNSLAADFWALKQLAERGGDAGAPGIMAAVADDLEIKLETCKAAGRGLGGRINVRVNTRRGTVEVRGLQVFFVAKIFESNAEENAEPFPRFSSPTENQLAPGRYLFWARDPATHKTGERMIVRAAGVQDIGLDLPVPK